MGKMSDLIQGRQNVSQKPAIAPKPEVIATEQAVVQNPPPSPPPRNRSQSDSVNTKTRINEKQQLAHLNNHLAGYFERVHRMENENRQLQVTVMRAEEQVRTETQKPLGLNFEQEVVRIRDTFGNENGKLRAEMEQLRPELEAQRTRILELEQFSRDNEKGRIAAQTALGELLAKIKGFEDEKLMWEREATTFQATNTQLIKSQKELELLLAQERNARVNDAKRLEELLSEFGQFKMASEKMLEVRAQEYMEKLEMTRTELTGQHQIQLQDALVKLRQEMDQELAQSRKPFQDMYEKKLLGLTTELETFRRNFNETTGQLQKLDAESVAWRQERGPLIEKINLLEQDNARLQSELRATLAKYQPLLQQAEADRSRLQRELQDLMQQYADLMDAKVQLHNEIAAYRNLLENEELHMSQWQQRLTVSKTTEHASRQQHFVAV